MAVNIVNTGFHVEKFAAMRGVAYLTQLITQNLQDNNASPSKLGDDQKRECPEWDITNTKLPIMHRSDAACNYSR